MKLLLDTNIFLEILLEQEQAMACRRLLSTANTRNLFISDFSLHSVGLALFRRKRLGAFEQFLNDVFINMRVGLLTLAPNDMATIGRAAQ